LQQWWRHHRGPSHPAPFPPPFGQSGDGGRHGRRERSGQRERSRGLRGRARLEGERQGPAVKKGAAPGGRDEPPRTTAGLGQAAVGLKQPAAAMGGETLNLIF
jgi:hypothetical protein